MPSRKTIISAVNSNLRLAPLILVLAFSLLYGFSYLNIYRQPHSYEQASLWIYKNIPAASKLIGVHWDDRLPGPLPGFDPAIFQNSLELPLYEADKPEKMRIVAEQMAKGDYLILPTQRLQGSLLRVPAEFPQTASFFRQLFSGHLGYKLIKTFKVRPSIGILNFNDDLADESLSVYDHPKVSIFKNEEHLSAVELIEKIYSSPLPGSLPSLAQIMSKDAPAEQVYKISLPPLLQIVAWLILIELLFFLAFPLAACLMPDSPDRGAGISYALGILIFGFCAWSLSSLQLIAPAALPYCILLVSLLLAALLFVQIYWGSWKNFLENCGQHFLSVHLLFYASFLFFLLIRSFQPEIFWGEKPMDFTFLNYFTRIDSLPPQDPWAAGNLMHYYYFGPFILGSLMRMIGVETAYGYNLAMALVSALMLCTAYSIFSWISRNKLLIAALSVGLILLSNLEVLYLVLQGRSLDFHLFWASSRLFTSPGITEYPLWSILFADLHAHLIALPFALCALCLALALFMEKSSMHELRFWLLRLFYGLSWGCLFITNSWDFISFAVITLIILTAKYLQQMNVHEPLRAVGLFLRAVFDGLLTSCTAIFCVLPFMLVSFGTIRSSHGWVGAEEFDHLAQILRHLAHWLVPILLSTLMLLGLNWRSFGRDFSHKVLAYFAVFLVCVFPLLLGSFSYLDAPKALPWGILVTSSLLLLLCGLSFTLPSITRAERFYLVCAMAALLIIPFAELRFINDHMNTIFKFYNQVWLLLGVAALGLAPRLYRELYNVRGSTLKTWSALTVLALPNLLFVICACGSLLCIVIMSQHRHIEGGPRPTLNGTAYLSKQDPDQAAAIRWLNQNIRGTPVMLEAQGPSYQLFSRISMHSGIPTVLGWDYHVVQRGSEPPEVDRRKADIKQIYSSANPEMALDLMRRYNVELIIIGTLERSTYPQAGLDKFAGRPDLFPLLFSQGTFSIFSTKYSQLSRSIKPDF